MSDEVEGYRTARVKMGPSLQAIDSRRERNEQQGKLSPKPQHSRANTTNFKQLSLKNSCLHAFAAFTSAKVEVPKK